MLIAKNALCPKCKVSVVESSKLIGELWEFPCWECPKCGDIWDSLSDIKGCKVLIGTKGGKK